MTFLSGEYNSQSPERTATTMDTFVALLKEYATGTVDISLVVAEIDRLNKENVPVDALFEAVSTVSGNNPNFNADPISASIMHIYE